MQEATEGQVDAGKLRTPFSVGVEIIRHPVQVSGSGFVHLYAPDALLLSATALAVSVPLIAVSLALRSKRLCQGADRESWGADR